MPSCFKEAFSDDVRVIIDCFEIFVESTSLLNSNAQCWSSYKHHKTVKILIGITPQGTICFISPSYGGRASDKFITEDSGLLDKIEPGDIVMADRGFLIEELLHLLGAALKIPIFTRGKSQLHQKELEETRHIANVRIHVERVIGLLRQKYKILAGTIPIHMLYPGENGVCFFDEMVVVCGGLVNLCPSIVA